MKYNKTKAVEKPKTVVNHQGGASFGMAPKLELISLLATGIETKFYEAEGERETRLKNLIAEISKNDKNFVAKALVYARTVIGQRSVTHIGAVNFAQHISGDELGKRFFSKRDRKANRGGIIFRLDDMLEIAACYAAKNPGKAFSNAIKKGFKDALESADAYELAKYQGKGKAITLVDIVNLVHPVPSAKMAPVFKELMNGELKQFNTVEDKNTKAGQEVAAQLKSGEITKAEATVALQEAKEDNYAELISTRKIGYLALLRNLRNILKNTKDKALIDAACELLTDEKLIKQSLVFPHQIDLALEVMLMEFSATEMIKFANALDKAYTLAIPNLTELFPTGRTAVVWDTSASMTSQGTVSNGSKVSAVKYKTTAATKAALIGATLAKGVGADLYHFASDCQRIKFNPNDSVNSIKNAGLALTGIVGHGTSFDSIFRNLKGAYDRIFIISDMQGGDSLVSNSSYQSYTRQHGQPYIYTVDMAGYGTTMFKPNTNKLIQLFGYSADIYEYIKKAEIDPKAILAEIEAIVI